MDLTHDWRALNEVLFQQALGLGGAGSSLVLLEENGEIVDGVSSTGRLFEDRGVTGISADKGQLDALAAKYGADQALLVPRRVLDQQIAEAASLGSNYFQQLESLREALHAQLGKKKNGLVVSRRHFVLDLFGSRLKRLLPRRFNVLLFVDQRPVAGAAAMPLSYQAILLSYSNGRLDQFFEPDFSGLHENRLVRWDAESAAIGSHLESRYILPCYGIFMYREDWDGCLAAAAAGQKPWRRFVRVHDEGRAAVYPRNKLLSKALLATQRIMVYFGRL
jgi:hypothetical protein